MEKARELKMILIGEQELHLKEKQRRAEEKRKIKLNEKVRKAQEEEAKVLNIEMHTLLFQDFLTGTKTSV